MVSRYVSPGSSGILRTPAMHNPIIIGTVISRRAYTCRKSYDLEGERMSERDELDFSVVAASAVSGKTSLRISQWRKYRDIIDE